MLDAADPGSANKGYQKYTVANGNAIYDQVMVRGWACDRLAICQWKTLAVNPNKEHKELASTAG